MDLGIRGKVAVVLGASKGMGRAAAKALADEGCSLAVAARDGKAVSEAFPGALALACDVTRDADRESFLKAALERYGRIDVLVNNCGGPRPGGFGDAFSSKDWQDAFERSLLQVVRWTEAVTPHMKGWGRIVNVVSTSVKQPIDQLLLSSSIRPGVLGYCKVASKSLAPKGITINSILPGLVRTDRAVEVAEARSKKEGVPVDQILREKVAEIPAGRLGEPEEVGALVAYLCSQQAAYVTGTTVTIDGGLMRTIL